jgi:hypothetical protein
LNSTPGDADLDGYFATNDLVLVFQAGGYEDAVVRNAGWASGDWNGDLDFGSDDLVAAFAAGQYEQGGAAVAVPEPNGHALWLLALIGCIPLAKVIEPDV